MKKFLILVLTILLSSQIVLAGELQNQWNSINISKVTYLENSNSRTILLDDYRGFINGGKSFYGFILGMLDQYSIDSFNYKYLSKIKQNYETNFINIRNWQKFELSDNEYKQLSEDVKVKRLQST